MNIIEIINIILTLTLAGIAIWLTNQANHISKREMKLMEDKERPIININSNVCFVEKERDDLIH